MTGTSATARRIVRHKQQRQDTTPEVALGRPEIQVTLRTEQNMGDHGEMVRIAHKAEPGETVEHLVRRLFRLGEFAALYRNPEPDTAWIELRCVVGTEPEPEPQPDPWSTTGAPF